MRSRCIRPRQPDCAIGWSSKRLVRREQSADNRRETMVDAVAAGRADRRRVTDRRRAEMARIVARIPEAVRRPAVAALNAFADAAGEIPEQAWSLGWP